jgi:hypothetical protein
MLAWAPDDTARRRIMVDNPQELFGFADARSNEQREKKHASR